MTNELPPRPKEIDPDASALSAVLWFAGIATFAVWSYRKTATAPLFLWLDQLAEGWPFLHGTVGQLAAIAITAAIFGLIAIRPLARRWVISELRAKKRRAERLAEEIEGQPKKAGPDAGLLQTAELLQQYGEPPPQKELRGWKLIFFGTLFGVMLPFTVERFLQIEAPNPSVLPAPVFWAVICAFSALVAELLKNVSPAK